MKRESFAEVAWPDECIYLVGARNFVETGSLHTKFYLTHSILVRGYPHRDVHMPGYLLALAPFLSAFGPTLLTGALLNAFLFLGSTFLVYAIGLELLADPWPAATAAALFTLMPPFPGYLFVVYPEMLVSFVFLAGLAWLFRGEGMRHAVVAGVLFGLGPLFRETLLLALPLYVARLRRRELLRGFMPAAVLILVAVVAPLSRDRAVHPNAIYPSVLEEARRSAEPLRTLASVLESNVVRNLRLLRHADPAESAEDMVLALTGVLALIALVSWWVRPERDIRLGLSMFASLSLLAAAVVTLYVVRERGGVWGGVRAFMPWQPLLLVMAAPLLFRPRRRWIVAGLVAAVALAFVAIDRRQAYVFLRYKQANHEDQDRNARYLAERIDRYHPTRIVSRSFLYGFTHYPVEVIWSLPEDHEELRALESAVSFDFLALHESSPLRLALIGNPRYLRINKDDPRAEFLVWRRLY
jgi:hypothetical protein